MDVIVVGSCNVDLVSYVPRLPTAGETIIGTKFSQGFGGKGANPAVMSARLGAKTALISMVGDDTYGKEYKLNLMKNDIDISHVGTTSKAATGVAPIFVNESGENSIVVVKGANDYLTVGNLEAARDLMQNSKILLCNLEIDPKVTLEALKMAHSCNIRSLFNMAPARAGLDQYFQYCDILVVNESEAEIITGIQVSRVQEAKVAAESILKKGCKVVVITLGENGAVVLSQDDKEAIHIPTPKVPAVDTTGAGDAFCGSLAVFLSTKPELGLQESVYRANRIAGITVQSPGTQTSYPHRKDLSPELFSEEKLLKDV
ncbi:ribokinase-like isoform X1 [Ostrea edulis]|uniref:ribokinase-like isoform X1 n=1 Tax=Ostrea edulis TaxID=37623 RepID=UPI002096306D|nr:ribokinase-like isoform X1 [Ostrea edulis]